MKAINFFLIGFLSAVFTNSNAQNTWTQISSFTNDAREYAVALTIGDKGYIGTGYSTPDLKKDWWEYDPVTETWTQKADFGGAPRASAVGFSIGSKGYVGTGIINWDGDGYSFDFWEYDQSTNSWTKKAKFPGGFREGAVGFSINDKGYVGTGTDGETFQRTKDLWEYDPSINSWTKKADFPGELRNAAVAFTIGSKGYVGTGFGDINGPRKDFYEYDPGTNSWTQKADFGGGYRQSAVGFSIGDKGYLGTGATETVGMTDDFWEYNSENDSWTQKADVGGEARSASGFAIDGKGYIGLGFASDFWQYTPACETPTGLITTNIKATSAKVNWNIVPGAQTYSVRYRKSGTTQWTKITAPLNYKKLTGLTPNTQYDWTVKSVCDAVNNISSDWSATQNFTTKPLKLEGENDDEETSLEVFPNPVSSTATISFSLNEDSKVLIELFSIDGKKVMTVEDENFSKGNHRLTFNRESLAAGIYFLKMKTMNAAFSGKLILE